MAHRVLPTNEERWALYEQANEDRKQIVASAQMHLTKHPDEFPSLTGTEVLPMQFDFPVSRNLDCPPMRYSVDFEFPRGASTYDVWKFYRELRRDMNGSFMAGPIMEESMGMKGPMSEVVLVYFDARPQVNCTPKTERKNES